MTKEEMIEQLNAALADEFEIDVEEITPDAPIKETFHIDSLSLVDMVALIESMYGVEIQNTEVGGILTFHDLYEYVYPRIKK